MTDYINRAAALAFIKRLKLKETGDRIPDSLIKCGNQGIDSAIAIIERIPAADVVEVVRCRECKWFNEYGCAIQIVDDSDKPTESDYCSFGERREDE